MKSNQQILFHPFRLDIANQRLWRDEQAVPLTLKAFALLRCLVERPGQLLTKDELLEAVWPETFVTDAVLKVRIGELRKALGDEPMRPRFIETAQRRGYRFVARVTVETETRREEWGSRQSLPAPPLVVGRAAELAQLRGILEPARGGQRQVVFISGEPGIGKTTLVEAFLNEAGSGLLIARGECLEQYGGSEAYLPWLDAFSRLCREREDCIALLRRQAPMWLAQMPWLLDETERATVQRETAGATRARMLREMAQAIEALTAETTLVLALEDLHWSDYSTLDLIAYVARRSEPARLLLIGTYRPVEVILSGHPLKAVKQELKAHQLCAELPLDFLTEAAVADYLRLRFTTNQFPAELPRLVHHRTDGNPLFMVNVVDHLLAHSLIDEAGHCELKAAVREIEAVAPASVRQMIERQVEQLDDLDQRVLEAASVAGIEFSCVAVAAGLRSEVIEVEECCERLARRQQFLRAANQQQMPDGTVTARYGFIHALYQNAFYERTTAARRAGLHQRIAESSEASHGDHATEIAAELALHFEEGHDWRRAVKYLIHAARQATKIFAAQEAVALANRGLTLVSRLPEPLERSEQELSLQIVLGNALIAAKGFVAPEVMQTYARARELCRQLGQTPQLLPVLYGLFAHHFSRGEQRTALELGKEFLTVTKGKSDPAMVVGHRMMGFSLFAIGELTQAREHLEQIASLYDPALHRRLTWLYWLEPGIAGKSTLALTVWFMGYPDLALKRHRETLQLAREVSHAQSTAYGLTWAAMHLQMRRDCQQTRELAEELIATTTEHGLALWLSCAKILRGWVKAELGQADEGISEMRSGLEAMRSTGSRMLLPYNLYLLAEGYGKARQFRDGLAVLSEALAPDDSVEAHYWDAEVYRLKGELLLLDGAGVPEVESCFQHGLEIARRQKARSLELRASTSLARLWQANGKRTEARALLSPIYNWFTEGFDTTDMQSAKLLLEELA